MQTRDRGCGLAVGHSRTSLDARRTSSGHGDDYGNGDGYGKGNGNGNGNGREPGIMAGSA